MRWRRPPEPFTDDGTPQWIADGAVPERWADPARLARRDRLAALPDDAVPEPVVTTRADADCAVRISAHRNYRDAVRAWASANGIDWHAFIRNGAPRG